MIVSTLIAAAVAAAQPSPAPQPMAAPSPAAEKKMSCCEKMAKGEGCACCKDMEHKSSAAAGDGRGGHSDHNH